ncbi:MAG: rRNA maturation RNase YbeY [Tenericutes bacterium 4572_104]|nr:MAG: rRNA maturation RNase YbeY [Tenericutes bacterium 4572_104]
MIKINIINQYDESKKYNKIIKSIIKIGYKHLKITKKNIISVILVDDSEIHRLNRLYRNIDRPTDVLSFENESDVYEIGDVFISIDTVSRQAKELDNSFTYELAFIALHGFLHCLGYDHITDEDNEEMMSLQNEIMEKSKIMR